MRSAREPHHTKTNLNPHTVMRFFFGESAFLPKFAHSRPNFLLQTCCLCAIFSANHPRPLQNSKTTMTEDRSCTRATPHKNGPQCPYCDAVCTRATPHKNEPISPYCDAFFSENLHFCPNSSIPALISCDVASTCYYVISQCYYATSTCYYVTSTSI